MSFVSVTQQFNTATSMGRLMLNVLLSFAQFEREIIRERTRDKIAATRRKGKWSGGMPLLGYDVVDTQAGRQRGRGRSGCARSSSCTSSTRSLLPVVQELNARGWTNKIWTTRKGTQRGGRPITKTSLHQLLTNPTYTGKVRYKGELFAGEHAGIVAVDLFDRVQAILRNGNSNGSRTPSGTQPVLLRGLARCTACDRAMSHSYTRRRTRRYRYYVCTAAQNQGWQACPSPSVPAAELERFVVDEVRTIARDRSLVAATWAAWRPAGMRAKVGPRRRRLNWGVTQGWIGPRITRRRTMRLIKCRTSRSASTRSPRRCGTLTVRGIDCCRTSRPISCGSSSDKSITMAARARSRSGSMRRGSPSWPRIPVWLRGLRHDT